VGRLKTLDDAINESVVDDVSRNSFKKARRAVSITATINLEYGSIVELTFPDIYSERECKYLVRTL
jgi:hypothetical protein